MGAVRIKESGDTVEVECICSITLDKIVFSVDVLQYETWKSGEKIQRAMPNLTPDQREILISGTSPAEWDHMFGIYNDE